MSDWNFQIRFTTGSTSWIDLTPLVLDQPIEKSEQLYGSGGSAARDVISFSIKHETTMRDAIFNADQKIEFKCYETTSSNVFTGIIDSGFEQTYGNFIGPIAIEAADNGYLLDKKIANSFAYPTTVGGTAYNIFATSSTGTSILHALLADAGYTSTQISTEGSITNTVQQVAETEGERTYKEYIDGLLMEYGYTYRFDEDGKFKTVNLRSTSTGVSHTFSNSNIAVNPPLHTMKTQQEYEAVEIKWSALSEKSVYLFTDEGKIDDGAWDNDNDLFENQYYPAGSSADTIWQQYDPKIHSGPYVIGEPIDIPASGWPSGFGPG